MKANIFFKSVSSKKLKESLSKQFGVNVDLNKYSREQLEDIRNKLRTRVFQLEGSAGYNELLTNETYQKDKAMLQLLNTRIKEMLGEDIAKLRNKMVELSEGKKGAKPDFLDLDKDGNKTEPMKAAAKQAKVKEEDQKSSTGGTITKTKTGVKHTAQHTDEPHVEPAQKKAKSSMTGAERRAEKALDKEQEKKGKEWEKRGYTRTVVKGKAASGSKEVDEAAEKCNHTPKGKKCPVHGMKECGSMYEASHQASTTMKHVKNPTKGEKDAAKDIKPGIKGYADRVAMLKSAEKDGRLKERATGGYSAKDAAAGKDLGKPGKQFAKIAKSAGERYGSKERGEKVAGAVLAKLRKESQETFKKNVRLVNESLHRLISENEEEKAKAITAAGDIVNDFTSWMQRVGQYQTKAIIELADNIRADFGLQQAEAFKQAVAPALAATLDTLTQQRESISNAVAALAGEEVAPEDQMGMEPEMGPPEEVTGEVEPDQMNAGDEFAASDAAAGGEEPSGREVRESTFAKKLAESHSIMAKLAR